MMPDLSEDLQDISDTRKTAVINDELKRLNVDIATLQETRLAGADTLKEKDYAFYWQRKSSVEPREHGVGFTVRNSLLNMVEPVQCRKQRMPLYVVFIDLTEAFDLVSQDCLFKALQKIGCPPNLNSLIESFHSNIKGAVQFNGSSPEPFDIHSGVKQGCVLAPMLFGIFFALLLRHAFGSATEGIYLRTRSDGRLLNLACLKAKTKVREALIRDILFVDDAVVATHTKQELQSLMNRFSQACKGFGLTISLK